MTAPSTKIATFGVPRVVHAGRELSFPVRKTLALLIYVSIEGRSTRARLAEMFWPGLEEATARRNLRHALHRLRAVGLGDALLADADSVALAGVTSDLDAFRELLRAGRAREALELRSGVFCDGLELDDAESFDAWLRHTREQFQREWRSAASTHARELEAAGDVGGAIVMHRQLLAQDPLQEATYRELMRLHDSLGERVAALEAFDRCKETLRGELQLEPLPETCLLAERIRARDRPARLAAADDSATTGAVPARLELQSVPLVARERELAILAGCGEAVVLVEGDAGVGKTRLALEARRRTVPVAEGGALADPDVAVVVRFSEMSSSTPFHCVVDALRVPDVADRLDTLEATWRRELSRLLPELRSAADEGGAEPQPATGGEARTRLLEALARALAVAAGPSRTVVFDDLQWADASSAELLTHLARRRGQEPASMARVLATARSVELADNAAVGVALQTLARTGDLARLALGAFDDWSMLQLVQRLSKSQGGVRFAVRLKSASGGNVFFALEMIRVLFESGELREDPGSGWSTRFDEITSDYAELPLPSSVVEAVRGRVARLGAGSLRMLETASLAEDGSTLAELQGATALSEWEALAGIERAAEANIVERSGQGFRFSHDLFRAAIRSGLSRERRSLIHAKLAAALQPTDAAPARIAAHWEAAGNAAAASAAWAAAAKAATAVYAYVDAAAHYGRAAALETDQRRAYGLHDERIESLFNAGLIEDQDSILATMLQVAGDLGDSALGFRALSRAAELAMRKGEMELSEQFVLRALAEYEPPEPSWHVHALNGAAFAALRLDRQEEALGRYLEARSVSQAAGIDHYAAAMAGFASMVCDLLGRTTEALALGADALAAAPAGTLIQAQVLNNSAFALRAARRRPEAIEQYRQAAAIAERRRAGGYAVVYHANLCESLLDDGQLEAAREAQRACVEAVKRRVEQASYLAALTLARVRVTEGRLGDAIESAREAVAQAAETADRREASAVLGLLLWRIGAVREAGVLADACDALPLAVAPRQALAPVVLRAAIDASPVAAIARIRAALVDPFSDRLFRDDLELAHVMLGRLACAAGDGGAALAAVAGIGYSVGHEAAALAIRLDAGRIVGRHDAAARDEAHRLLDSGALPALARLELMRSVAESEARRARRKTLPPVWRDRLAVLAQALADSLRAMPALQSGFIRKHRDLLT